MNKYRVRLVIWPYSGVKREPASYQSDSERALRGVEMPEMVIEANGFSDASRVADAIRMGVQLDERVWRVNIAAIIQTDDTTRPTGLLTEGAYA